MKKAYIFLAEGFEEMEAVTPLDLLRRVGIDAKFISVSGEKSVTGSHGITVEMDTVFAEVDFEGTDMIVLPGGMPGTVNLEAFSPLMEQVEKFHANKKWIAAICAAPSIFGHRGMLNGKPACANPGFESHLEGADVKSDPAVVAGHIITSRGMGTAIPFALAILEQLEGTDAVVQMKKGIVF